MSAERLTDQWTRPARVRGTADDLVMALPVLLFAAALAWRLHGLGLAALVAIVGLAILAGILWKRSHRFDRAWLTRRLDATRGDMEDSADLLFADADALGPLQRLQRARLEQRIADAIMPDLRPAWSTRYVLILWAAALLGIVAVLAWPARSPIAGLTPSVEGGPAVPGVPRLIGQRLRVLPPAYTGLPARDLPMLDAKVPQGSRLVWTFAFAPEPASANLAFLDGRRIALAKAGDRWTAGSLLDRSGLYRVVPQGGRGQPPLHRLDAVVDQPPQVEVRAPATTLTLVTPGQRGWALQFDVNDDYGVAPVAQLRVTIAAGEGENVTFRERTLSISGTGTAIRKRFAISLDFPALGFTEPGDLIVQLTARDNRTPGPQTVVSSSLIARRPAPEPDQGTGLDNAVRSALPAYLRSQRQVIIDAEALLKQRRSLPPARFLAKSMALSGDQQALRMRYGQFLGQENEGEPEAPPTGDKAAADGHDDEHKAPGGGAAVIGQEEDVLGTFGHPHDEGEAATLFDPKTRAKLTEAVDQMWQSELALRQGDPARALPFANKALVLIKDVQQATRVFLARVGSQLPPIDETRRLTGKRDDIVGSDAALAAREDDGSEAATAAWAAIDGLPTAGGLRFDNVARWVRAQGGKIQDPLALEAAIDALRAQPGCASCRTRLRGLLWSALSRPTPGVIRRGAGDADGRRYLDALGRGAE
jgi:hypothetical protein